MNHPALGRSVGEHAGRAALYAQCCRSCDATYFPVGASCARCGGSDLDRVPLSPRGEVFSWTAIHRAAEGWKTPYVVALVDFPEGPRIFAQVTADAAAMRTGMAVEVAFGTPPAGRPDDAYYFVPAAK